MVEKKLGITPRQVIDLKALMGDNSDNIPGVKGIGPKTAANLIQKFNSLEKIYEFLEKNPNGNELIKGALLTKLIDGKELAFLSKELATIECQAPIDFDLENCRVTAYDKNKVIEIFKTLNFKSLINFLPKDAFETSVQEALF
jgi:DNA polymerase-1